MRCLLLSVVLSIFTASCSFLTTQVHLTIPKENIELTYSYSVFQEKCAELEKTEDGYRVYFTSKSDPMKELIRTVDKMVDTAQKAGMIAALATAENEALRKENIRLQHLARGYEPPPALQSIPTPSPKE